MKSLEQSFKEFADHFPIPQEERTRLFRIYKDTYERTLGLENKTNGQTQTKSKRKSESPA
jgi:hypothetical protein